MSPEQQQYAEHLGRVDSAATAMAAAVERLRQAINDVDSTFRAVEDTQRAELHSLDRDDVIADLCDLGRARRSISRTVSAFIREIGLLQADNVQPAVEPEPLGVLLVNLAGPAVPVWAIQWDAYNWAQVQEFLKANSGGVLNVDNSMQHPASCPTWTPTLRSALLCIHGGPKCQPVPLGFWIVAARPGGADAVDVLDPAEVVRKYVSASTADALQAVAAAGEKLAGAAVPDEVPAQAGARA